jgi:hypothetical protein
MVFLSYSRKDHFFADLAVRMLAESNIELWRDQGKLRAGEDWRHGIDQGIADSMAVVIALSGHSWDSSYVTYEWAYALGKGKPIIPLKLGECTLHPKLEAIQYLDFTGSGAPPWKSLVDRITEIADDNEESVKPLPKTSRLDPKVKAILDYLNKRGYQMASFDRLRRRIDEKLTDARLTKLIADNPTILRPASAKGNRPGLAKLVP